MARLSLVSALLVLAGCEQLRDLTQGEDGERRYEIGTMYAQCEGRAAGGSSSAAAHAVAAELLPPSATLRCSDTITFTVDGAQVSLVYLAYGELQDCPAGCFSSMLCALRTSDASLLYSAAWVTGDERPAALQASCPGYFPDSGGDTRLCTEPTPGALHPVTGTDAFATFRASSTELGARFRLCFVVEPPG